MLEREGDAEEARTRLLSMDGRRLVLVHLRDGWADACLGPGDAVNLLADVRVAGDGTSTAVCDYRSGERQSPLSAPSAACAAPTSSLSAWSVALPPWLSPWRSSQVSMHLHLICCRGIGCHLQLLALLHCRFQISAG